MKWRTLDVEGEMGIHESPPCSVCRHFKTDTLYFPVGADDSQAKWIKTIWSRDHLVDFLVCEDCMEGHCGLTTFPEKNANSWLEKRIKEFKARRKLDSK